MACVVERGRGSELGRSHSGIPVSRPRQARSIRASSPSLGLDRPIDRSMGSRCPSYLNKASPAKRERTRGALDRRLGVWVVFRAGYTTNSAIWGAHRRGARARVRCVSGPTTPRAGGARPGPAGSDAREEEREVEIGLVFLLSCASSPALSAPAPMKSDSSKRDLTKVG